jgi:hypothetical protein
MEIPYSRWEEQRLMTRNPRLWLGALALAAALLFQVSPARAADDSKPEAVPEPVGKYLPNDSEYVVRVNFQQAQKSAILKKGLEELKAKIHQGEAQKVLAALGFDPLKDLDALTLAGPVSKDPEKPLAVLHGRFDPDKFQKVAQEAVKKHGEELKIEQMFGHTVWVITPKHRQPNAPSTYYVALADKNTLFATAGKSTLEDAFNKASGKAKSKLKKELAALVAKIDPKQTLAIVLLPGAIANADFLPPQVAMVKQAFEDYKTLRIGLTLGENVHFETVVGAKDAETAKKLAQKVKQGLAAAPFALMAFGDNPKVQPFVEPITDLLKTIKTAAKGDTVTITSKISKDLIKQFEKAGKEAQGDK